MITKFKLFEGSMLDWDLNYIIERGDIDKIKQYINAGHKLYNSELIISATIASVYNEYYIDILKLLISSGADIEGTTNSNYDKKTALFFAIIKTRYQAINILLDAGANVYKLSSYGESVLFQLDFDNILMKDICKKLLNEVDWSTKNLDGDTFLDKQNEETKNKIIKEYPDLYNKMLMNIELNNFGI